MQKNLELIQGNSYNFNIKFVDGKAGDPVDITTYTILLSIKKTPDIPDEEATGENGTIKDVIPTTPTEGICQFTLSIAETNNFTGKYYYDISFITSPNIKKTLLIGTMNFEKAITRRYE